jgi:hypothetical protein
MTDFFASVSGYRVPRLRLHVPGAGAWFADLDLDESVTLAGTVEVTIGDAKLTGTVASNHAGAFVGGSRVRVVGGGNGWGSLVSARGYHNDAGVKARTVADDVARAVGETIGTFAPAQDRLGSDYVRRACLASRVLEDAAGGSVWWVGLDGTTNVGARPVASSTTTAQLLEFDARTRIATLTADSLLEVMPGSRLTDERLTGEQTIRDLELEIGAQRLRATVWLGGNDSTQGGRLGSLLATIAQRATDGQIVGLWRYRVVSMATDGRVNLQAVKRGGAVPDLLTVDQWPGVAGAFAKLALGAIVLVQFVEGDPSQPVITGFTKKGAGGFVPDVLTLGAESEGGASEAARKGDSVKVLLPPAVFSGTIGGVPATGVLTFPTGYTLGTIETGSPKVKVGT